MRELTMLHARLREVRKAKGLTLDEVARRIKPKPTTAQTIGRLETGMRTLTLDWVQRIAEAMGVDPAELLALPQGGDVVVEGLVGADGRVLKKDEGVVTLRLGAQEPVAIRIDANQGQYRVGDVIICEAHNRENVADLVGCDCLVEDGEGRQFFGKLAALERGNRADLLPLGAAGAPIRGLSVSRIAPATVLVRQLTS